MARKEIDYSNPFRQMSMGVLKENARMAFQKKTGIIIFTMGGMCMTINDFTTYVYCAAGNFRVHIEYDKGEWEITKQQ